MAVSKDAFGREYQQKRRNGYRYLATAIVVPVEANILGVVTIVARRKMYRVTAPIIDHTPQHI